jgi:hypothetical protein
MQADTTLRELANRWIYYYHATRTSPAEFKAWTQAKDRAGNSTAPPAYVPAPARPGEPSGQPTWLVVSLGAWRRHWRSSLDWPCWPPGARTAGLRSGTRPNDRHGQTARWGCRAHPAAPSPCRGRIGPLACPRPRVLSVRWSGGNVRAHYFAPDGRAQPAKTQGCIAVSPRLLIRMKSEVQVLPGPLPGSYYWEL